MDRERLETTLAREFDADQGHCRVVARQATDLADSGKLEREYDIEPSVEVVVSNLQDAPDDTTLRERWNWWMGSLSVAGEGYERFAVRLLD